MKSIAKEFYVSSNKDIVYLREKHVLFEYFNAFKDRNHVKYIIMDMWEPYKDLAK